MEWNLCSCWKGRSCISEPIRCTAAGGRPGVSARLHLLSLFLLFAGSWSIKSDRSRLNKVKKKKKKMLLHAAESVTKRVDWNPSALACTRGRSALCCPLLSGKDITTNSSDNPECEHGEQTKIYFYFCNQQQNCATGQPGNSAVVRYHYWCEGVRGKTRTRGFCRRNSMEAKTGCWLEVRS